MPLFTRPAIAGARVLLAALTAFLVVPTQVASANPADGTWTRIADLGPPPAPPSGRTSFVLVSDAARGRLVAFSGAGRGANFRNDVAAFTLATGHYWIDITPTSGPSPVPRYGSAGICDAADDQMIVFGGFSGASELNDVWALSLAGAPTWTQLFPSGPGPSPRQDAAAIYDPIGQRMILFGGYTDSGWTNEVWALSLSGTPTWTQIIPSGAPPSARDLARAIYDSNRGRIVVFGGWSAAGYLGDTWALDLSGSMSWSLISTASAPTPRRDYLMAFDANSDRVVLFGGFDGQYLGDLWQLTLSGTPQWSPLAAGGIPPTARAGGRAEWDPVGDRFIAYGGYDEDWRDDVNTLSPDASPTWTRVAEDHMLVLVPRRDYALGLDDLSGDAVIFGGTTYAFGGPPGYTDTDETWRLSLSTPGAHWQFVQVSGVRPSPRHGQRGVWDPVRQRLLVFGGYDANYLNDLWALPAGPSPTWQALSTTGTPPPGRMYFGLAYDSIHDRLIVVGGHSGFSGPGPAYWNDAWQLPLSGPGAMTWSPLTPSGTPPDPRWVYDMVFDAMRNRVVLFGGVTSSGRPNDVWALDLGPSPAWTQILPSGLPPSGRSDHAMIFDPVNDRLVLFGGFDTTVRNDTWSMNFSGSPHWQQLLPDGGPPVPRDIMHAAYDATRAQLVMFGGGNGGTFFNDTWTLPMPGSPVPVANSLVDSHAETGLVRIAWFVENAASAISSVQRREGAGAWQDLGAPGSSGQDRVSYEDRAVSPGHQYGYRLTIRVGGETTLSSEVVILVPNAAVLALVGAQPNPIMNGSLDVAFSLPPRTAARLDLVDLAGRVIATREVGALGEGAHVVRLSEGLRLHSGMYFIRLESRGQTLSSKALVVN